MHMEWLGVAVAAEEAILFRIFTTKTCLRVASSAQNTTISPYTFGHFRRSCDYPLGAVACKPPYPGNLVEQRAQRPDGTYLLCPVAVAAAAH